MRGDINISEFIGSGNNVKRHLDGCNFRFYSHYTLNKQRTEEVGYPQHDPAEFIEIIIFNGDRTTRAVEDRDRRAYPQEYERFKEREGKPVKGMYLREWCMITPAALADLEAFGLKTVEEVADLPSETVGKYKFLTEWSRKANSWLKNAKAKQADCARLEESLHELKVRYQKLEDQYYNALRRIEATEGTRFNA